ncbi:MAG: hypothetical protein LDLANPLL_01014 [Turneriella sp.]|nr:hypothetical protein [Turneriella sp.]
MRRKPSYFFTPILFFTVAPLYAYTDPGTGSLALQVILASALSAWVGVKVFGRRIKEFFFKVFQKEKSVSCEKQTIEKNNLEISETQLPKAKVKKAPSRKKRIKKNIRNHK